MDVKQPTLITAAGTPVKLPPEEIPDAFLSGKVGFVKGERIPVLDPSGRPGSIASEDAAEAFKQGFKYEPMDSQLEGAEAEKYGDDPVEQLKAGAEGFARGATLGGSDFLERGFGVDPHAISARAKQNPVTSTLANVAGAAAPALLSGGSSAAAEAAGVLPAAIVGRLGAGVTESVASGLGSFAAQSAAKSIAASAVSHAAGSAVEGAVFGAGGMVSEAALGDDPDLSAEKVAANVGLGALIGGGVGALLGGASGVLKRGADIEVPKLEPTSDAAAEPPTTLSDAEQAARYGSPPGTFASAMEQMNLSSEQKQGILEGLAKQKPNAPEIRAAAEEIGAPVIESQTSASEHVHRIDSNLMQSASPIGVARHQFVQGGIDKAEQAVARSLGEGTDMSLAEVGDKLKESVAQSFAERAGPVQELYSQIEEYAPAVPVTERSTGSISRNIKKIIEDEGLIKGTPEHQFVENMADGLDQVENLQQLKNFRTAMARSSSPETRYVAGIIKDKLDNLEQNAIRRYAETMKTPVAKNKILSLLDQIDQAKAGYRSLRQEMGEIGSNVLGRRKIYGPQDFLDAIDAQTPEKFAKKLFAKDNSRFLGWFSEKFPAETQLLMQYQRAAIRQAAEEDGGLKLSKIFGQLDKLSPEVKGLMFNPQEIRQLEAAQTYIEALPKNINPSGTSKAEAYRRFFSNPIAATAETFKDAAAVQALKQLGKMATPADAERVHLLIRMERMGQDVGKAIQSGVKDFVSSRKDVAVAGAISAASVNYLSKNKLSDIKPERSQRTRQEMFEKRYAEISNLVSDPNTFSDRLADNLSHVSQYAPKVSQSLTQTAVKAAQFLYSKAPKNPNSAYALSPVQRKWHPSDAELSKWERYVSAVDHPMGVIQDLKRGVLSGEGVEVLRSVYPKLYGEVVSQLMDHITDMKHELPYAKRLQLSTFFGLPIDAASDPKFVAQMQALHAQASGPSTPQQGSGISLSGASKMKRSQQTMTDTERVLTRT